MNGLAVRVDVASRHHFPIEYERPVATFLNSRVRSGDEVWNVGANVGGYVLQLGQLVGPGGRLLAFEPNPHAASILAENVRLNGLDDRVEIVRMAVGERAGEADLYARGFDGMSRLGRPNPALGMTSVVRTAVTTLDQVTAERGRPPDWVVMDIEGWEIQALKSARDLLGCCRFVIELHPSAWPWSGHSRADLEALLSDHALAAVPLTGQADPFAQDGHVFIDFIDGPKAR